MGTHKNVLISPFEKGHPRNNLFGCNMRLGNTEAIFKYLLLETHTHNYTFLTYSCQKGGKAT